MLPQAPPSHCRTVTVRGVGCREFRGLVHCLYYDIWLCPRHHNERLARWPGREEHRAVCGPPRRAD